LLTPSFSANTSHRPLHRSLECCSTSPSTVSQRITSCANSSPTSHDQRPRTTFIICHRETSGRYQEVFCCRWRRTVSHIPSWQVHELTDCTSSCGCLQCLGWGNTCGSSNALRQLHSNASSRFACRRNYLNADKDAGTESAACLRRNTLCSNLVFQPCVPTASREPRSRMACRRCLDEGSKVCYASASWPSSLTIALQTRTLSSSMSRHSCYRWPIFVRLRLVVGCGDIVPACLVISWYMLDAVVSHA
jgi:hypothetical protein